MYLHRCSLLPYINGWVLVSFVLLHELLLSWLPAETLPCMGSRSAARHSTANYWRFLALISLSAGYSPAARPTARPALRLGGEWAGLCLDSDGGQCAVLTTEAWKGKGPGAAIHRRQMQVREDTAISHTVLPTPCSGSTVLQRANMLDLEVLNARAWTLDSVDENSAAVWTCETVFDGLGGEWPDVCADAMECPVERTRVQCSFNVDLGILTSASVHVIQERCWSSSPVDELVSDGSSGDLDKAWVSSAVGFLDVGGQIPCSVTNAAMMAGSAGGEMASLALAGGVSLTFRPGMLEMKLTSGSASRNSYEQVIVRRSWAGVSSARSIFAEVETVDERTGDR